MATSPVLASPNRAPVVDAGRDFSVDVGVVAPLDGTIMDDDAPVTLDQVASTWTKVSGPGKATFENATVVDTGVSFDAFGTYVLELTANDTELSGNATVTVTVAMNAGSGAGGDGGDGGDATAVSAGADSGGAAAVAGGGGALGSGATSSGGASTSGAENRGGTGTAASGGDATIAKSDSGCGCRLGSRRRVSEPLLALLAAALVAVRRRRRP
jgi:hypothetical protein